MGAEDNSILLFLSPVLMLSMILPLIETLHYELYVKEKREEKDMNSVENMRLSSNHIIFSPLPTKFPTFPIHCIN